MPGGYPSTTTRTGSPSRTTTPTAPATRSGRPAPPPAIPSNGPGCSLTLEAAQPAPAAWLLEAATALFDTAVADAWQRDGHPGFIYTVDASGQPVVTARMHWVACEAVLAADALHRRTGEERFAAAAARWWGEIDRYFLDRQHGGWWQELAPDMTPATVHLVGQAGSLPLLPGPPVPVAAPEPDRAPPRCPVTRRRLIGGPPATGSARPSTRAS